MTRPGLRPRRARLLPDDASGRAEAVAVLRAGGIVAMPTDTVYGVGVALAAPDGLPRLFAAKDRPLDRAIVLLVADLDQAASVGVLSPAARILAERFWPGGLTLVLTQGSGGLLPTVLTAGSSTIGIRLPNHDSPGTSPAPSARCRSPRQICPANPTRATPRKSSLSSALGSTWSWTAVRRALEFPPPSWTARATGPES